MNDGPSPVFKVIHWRDAWIYLYRPNVWWVWKRWRISRTYSRSGKHVSTRILAGMLEVSVA